MRILLVEDEDAAEALVLDEMRGFPSAEMQVASSLAEAVELMDGQKFDCVLLDLSLPDGWGLASLLRVRRHARGIPLVVLSGTQGEGFRDKAMRAGAAAFINKGEAALGAILETVVSVVAEAEAGTAPGGVIGDIARLGQATSPVSRRLFGQTELVDEPSPTLDGLVSYYVDLLELALEETAFVASKVASESLRDLARTLGRLHAGPRDIVQLHASVLEVEEARREGATANEFINESRIVVLELMGYLASYYRAQALGHSPHDFDGDT